MVGSRRGPRDLRKRRFTPWSIDPTRQGACLVTRLSGYFRCSQSAKASGHALRRSCTPCAHSHDGAQAYDSILMLERERHPEAAARRNVLWLPMAEDDILVFVLRPRHHLSIWYLGE